jgi:hypothetical protein
MASDERRAVQEFAEKHIRELQREIALGQQRADKEKEMESRSFDINTYEEDERKEDANE